MTDEGAEPETRRRRRIALAVSLLLNLMFVVALHFGTRPHGRLPPPRASALQVRLIAPLAAPSPADVVEPPQPVPPPVARRRPVRASTQRAERARRKPETPDATAPTEAAILDLVERDGRIRIPEMPPAPTDAPFAAPIRGNAFARTNPVPYSPTRFDKYFPPVDETLGGEIVRKTTITHTWITPWGTQITCSTSLLFAGLMGGCSWGHAPSLTGEELRAMRADPPMPRPHDDPQPDTNP